MSDSTAMDREMFRQLAWVSRTYRGRHDERRRYEVRFLVSALTLLALGTAAALSQDAKLPSASQIRWLIWFFPLAFAAITSAHLWSVHKSNRVDMIKAQDAERKVLQHFKIECSSARPGLVERWRNWFFQSCALLLCALTAATLVQGVLTTKAGTRSGMIEDTAGSDAPNSEGSAEEVNPPAEGGLGGQ